MFMIRKYLHSTRFWLAFGFCAIVVAVLLLSKKVDKTSLDIEYVSVEKETDIRPVTDSLVVPILYNNVQLLHTLPIERRKKKFVDLMLPAILIYQNQLMHKKQKVEILQNKAQLAAAWTAEDSLFMDSTYILYETDSINELINRMHPPPVSLVIAQAALESGWGSSRFFKEANNVFGIWSFSADDERIVANQSREGKPIYLKKYANLLGSVEDYHFLLAKSGHYAEFRDCLLRGCNDFELIWYLRKYSERRDHYVVMLRNVIVANDLTIYDKYRLDPKYFTYPED